LVPDLGEKTTGRVWFGMQKIKSGQNGQLAKIYTIYTIKSLIEMAFTWYALVLGCLKKYLNGE